MNGFPVYWYVYVVTFVYHQLLLSMRIIMNYELSVAYICKEIEI